jgi:hypothetical protein
MLYVVSLWYQATLKGSDPLETLSSMNASARAVPRVLVKVFGKKWM